MARVKLELEIYERVKYHRYLELEEADFKRIDKALDSENRKERERAEEELRCMIDPYRDVLDADDLEVVKFRPSSERDG